MVDIPINTIVILAIAVVALLALIAFFVFGFGTRIPIDVLSVAGKACLPFQLKGCTTEAWNDIKKDKNYEVDGKLLSDYFKDVDEFRKVCPACPQ